jgi:predicted phosphate transport protein (TIGR00153 family)
MKLLPREEKFFTLFLQQVEIISQASRLLLEGVEAGNSRLEHTARQIAALERKGDEIIHEVFYRLNHTFLTPLDPEDIHRLSTLLDDVLDGLEDTAHRLVAYQMEPIPRIVVELARIVNACAKSMRLAFEALNAKRGLMEHCIEINRLEGEADRLTRIAVAELFQNEKNPIRLIKSKEIYDVLEGTSDRCEDVADVLQRVLVKNG